VWVWLPGSTEPVVAGVATDGAGEICFSYAQSYLRRAAGPIMLQPVGLPLQRGVQRPPVGLDAHGVIRDAAPDSWGMQVLLRRMVGAGAEDTNELPLLTYLAESGSNRIGALDFQASPVDYVPRHTHGSLTELVEAGDRLARGVPFSVEVDDVLTYGSAVGGARPKALLIDEGPTGRRELIAKFSVSTDTYPWVEAEAVGMELARRCGIGVPATTLTHAGGRDVLLVERFDRPADGTRRSVLSGLTLLGLHEMAARHGSYVDLAEQIRLRFVDPTATLRELFTRIVVNVLVGNTDDHPRNLAAFWDGEHLELTPAYDVCPQPRSTGEAAQAMAYGPGGQARSRLADVAAAASTYRLTAREAAAIVDRCSDVVSGGFDDVCTALGVAELTRDLLWRRSVANASVFSQRGE
jgi:serine/threonine-protein kinase HipA